MRRGLLQRSQFFDPLIILLDVTLLGNKLKDKQNMIVLQKLKAGLGIYIVVAVGQAHVAQ